MTSNSAGKGRRFKPRSARQEAFLKHKAERDRKKAERESRERLDAWLLQWRYPEKAKAKRLKGTKNNKEASHWRSQMFVERVEAWPSVLSAEEMGLKIRAYLREQATWKWKGCAKHYPKKEASVRKKLTKLGVYRFNFKLDLWFKCGSPEEALEEAKRVEAEARRARWEAEQEAKEAKRKAEEARRLEAEAEKQRQDAYATRPIDLASLTPDEVALGLWFAKRMGWLEQGQGLDDLGAQPLRMINRGGVAKWLDYASNASASYKAKLAEAVLVAD